jgi:hypothetical protein
VIPAALENRLQWLHDGLWNHGKSIPKAELLAGQIELPESQNSTE